MIPERVLSEKIAKDFLANPESVDLCKFDSIDDDAALKVSKYSKDLRLSGLTSLSDTAAERIKKHKGGRLFLEGLTKLSKQAAESLGKHPSLVTEKDLAKIVKDGYQQNLSQALNEIASCGIMIDKSVPRSLNDWLHDPELLERDVFFGVLSIMASEGWAYSESLPIGSRGFSLDFEGIYDEGDYQRILERFAFISGQSYRLSEIEDHVDVAGGEVWVRFRLDDRLVDLNPEIEGDWVCPKTVAKITKLLTPKGAKFFAIDCGQSLAFFCFSTRIAKEVSKKIKQEKADVRVWP